MPSGGGASGRMGLSSSHWGTASWRPSSWVHPPTATPATMSTTAHTRPPTEITSSSSEPDTWKKRPVQLVPGAPRRTPMQTVSRLTVVLAAAAALLALGPGVHGQAGNPGGDAIARAVEMLGGRNRVLAANALTIE